MIIVGTDSNGGVLYKVPGRKRGRTRYEQGPTDATESTAPGSAPTGPGKARKPQPGGTDKPAGQGSSEGRYWPTDTGWDMRLNDFDEF